MLVFMLTLSTVQGVVVSVVEACRHGARSPITDYYWDTGYWNQGMGELTQEGMRQHFFNGAEFRNRYIINNQILSPNYNPSQLYVRSTGYNRTIMSAQSQLMGWFPEGPSLSSPQMMQKAVPPIKIQNEAAIITSLGMQALPNYFSPVPVHVVSLSYDHMLYGYNAAVCPYMNVITKTVQQTAEYQFRIANYTNYLQKQLYGIFGQVLDYETAGWYADNLICDEFHGYPWPEGMTEGIYQQMIGIMNYSNSYFFNYSGAYLASSQFYSEVLTIFNGVISGSSAVKFGYFSAHDTTLIGFLTAIQNFNGQNPPFASTLIFELIEESGEYFVNVKYNDEELTINGCQIPCPFDSFQKYLNSWIITDVVSACQIPPSFDTSGMLKNHFINRST